MTQDQFEQLQPGQIIRRESCGVFETILVVETMPGRIRYLNIDKGVVYFGENYACQLYGFIDDN